MQAILDTTIHILTIFHQHKVYAHKTAKSDLNWLPCPGAASKV